MKILLKVLLLLCSIMFCPNLVKAQQPNLTLSADPIAFGGGWISVKASIPENNVSNSPITLTLIYQGSDRFLDNPPQSILIPANKSEIRFDIDIEDIPDIDQVVAISARATGFAGSNSLSVTLARDFKPKGSVITLSSVPTVLGGGSVLVTVRLPEINKSNMPISVELSYGDGKSWLKNPPTSLFIEPGKDEAEFTIEVKDDFASNEQILDISAKAAKYSQYANLLKIKLLPPTIKSPEEGVLTLPPLPKLKIQNGRVTPNLGQEVISRSYDALNGFWIACEFKYKEEYIFALRDERWLDVHGTYYLWIPLERLKGYKHNLYYYGRASYDMVDGEVLRYGKNQVTNMNLKRGYRLNLISNLVYKQDTGSKHLNPSSLFSNSFLQQVGLASINHFSSSYARYPSEDITNSFGFHRNKMHENIAALTKTLIENTRPIVSSHLIKGDQSGYKKAYAQFVPSVLYELGNERGPFDGVDLEQYIKYDDVQRYIQKIFHDQESFNDYLNTYEEVRGVNKNRFPLNKWGARLYQSDYSMAIRNYCIALFNGSAVYGNPHKYYVEVNVPTLKQKDAVLELYKPENRSSGYKAWKSDPSQAAVTLTTSRPTLKAGGAPLTVTLTYAPGSPGIDKVKIKLLYEGTGAEFIDGPKTIFVDVKDVAGRIKGIPAVSFAIKTNAGYKLSDNKIVKIIAKTLDADKKPKTIGSIILTLEASQYDIKEVPHAEFEFPPIPKLKIENEVVSLDALSKTTSWGKNTPDGFFVQCKLKAKFTGSANFNKGITEYKYLPIDKSNPNKPIYLWIPLKKNNPLKYRITAYYKLGNSEMLHYGQSNNQQDSYTKMTGSQSATSKFDEQFREDYRENSEQKESTQTHSVTLLDDIATGNSFLKAQGTNMNMEHGLNLPSQGINFSNSFWTNSSQNNYKNHTNSTNTFNGTAARNLLEAKIGYKLGSRNSSSITDQVSTNLSAQHAINKSQMGPPIPHFVKAGAFIQPVLTYSLVDPSKGTLENIADYIDYEFLNCLEAKPKTLEEYIQYIMEPDQFNEEGNPNNTTLACYLRTFPQVNVMNKEIGNITKTIRDYMYNRYAYRTKYLDQIQVDSYTINITDFNAPYSAIFVYKSIPINCGPVSNLSHQFTLDPGGKDAISTFQWDAAPSSTHFQLEIRDNNGEIVSEHPLEREHNSSSKEPHKPQLFDRRTPYSVSVPYYAARVKSKCGADGEWSVYSGPITFTRDRSACKVTGIQATYTPGNGYHITWDRLDGIVGYKLEYANENEAYRAACRELASWRNDPCDETLTSNEYFHTSTSNFNIKVTPICSVGKGLSTVANFKLHDLVPCTAINNSVTVTFDADDSRPIFEWELPSDGVASLIETKENGRTKWGRKTKTYVQTRENRVGDGESLIETDVLAYTPGKTYVVRISSQCVLDINTNSKSWTSPSPEVIFTIPIVKHEGEKLNAFPEQELSSLTEKSEERRDPMRSSTLSDLEPDLLIAPNPVTDRVTFSIVNLIKPADEVTIKLYGINSNQELYSERQTNIENGKKLALDKDLPVGVYILAVLLDGKTTLTKQFVRQ